jgi:hypothetical protein
MDTNDNQKQTKREHIEGSNDSKLPALDDASLVKNSTSNAKENKIKSAEDPDKKNNTSNNSLDTEVTQ